MSRIEELLPHRPPFLFVDRLEVTEKENIVGYKKFGPGEFFFRGHFPSYPVVPGVILVETLAQCGGAGIRAQGLLPGEALFFLAAVEKAKFREQVRPGDEVRMEIENLRVSPRTLKQRGRGYVGETLAVEAEWLCIVSEAPAESPPAPRLPREE